MSEVFIAGIGMTPVGEHWELSLANLSARALLAAIKDAGNIRPQALYVGNYLASTMSGQANLGTLIADNAGLGHIETFTAEAGEASGAAALHMGYLAVKSGYVNAALVVGVEKYTDMVGAEVEGLVSQSMDSDFEATEGLTPVGQAGMLMSRYMESCRAPRESFGSLPLLAHANAAHNPNALYRKAVSLDTYSNAPMLALPLNLFDAAPYADGAAAVLLVNEDLAQIQESGTGCRFQCCDRRSGIARPTGSAGLQRANTFSSESIGAGGNGMGFDRSVRALGRLFRFWDADH